MELEFSKPEFQLLKNFTCLELKFARLDFQASKLELEFAKLEFHVDFFFFFFKFHVRFMLVGPRVVKLIFEVELKFAKLEFQNQSN